MKFFGELLIFVLLFTINLRVFFVSSVKRDPLVALAPLTFILAIFQIFSWGVEIFTLLGVILSFLVLISNFHALFRYTERLYVDHYSILMKCWAIFTDILSLGAIVCLMIFAPMDVRCESINVVENRYRYTGKFTTGIEPAKTFDNVSTVLYEFYPKQTVENKEEHNEQLNGIDDKAENIVLFIPDKRGDTNHYKPFIKFLASKGYKVCSADFFTKDSQWFYSFWDWKIFRRAGMVAFSLKYPEKFNKNRELYTYNITRECDTLLKILKDKYGDNCKIFIISDSMSNDAASDFVKKYPGYVTGHLKLDTIKDYNTAGYGFIAQTDPLLYAYMGFPREFNFETTKLIVKKAQESINF